MDSSFNDSQFHFVYCSSPERQRFVESQTDLVGVDIENLLGLQVELEGLKATVIQSNLVTAEGCETIEAHRMNTDETDNVVASNAGTQATAIADAESKGTECADLEWIEALRILAEAGGCDADVQTSEVDEPRVDVDVVHALEFELLRYRRLLQALEFALSDSPERDAEGVSGSVEEETATTALEPVSSAEHLHVSKEQSPHRHEKRDLFSHSSNIPQLEQKDFEYVE